MRFLSNLLLRTDSYKLSHAQQYPAGTETVYSYFEARKGSQFDSITFFGLQHLLKKHLAGQVVTQEKIDAADALSRIHLGSDSIFNRAGWQHILDVHDGKLPLRIRAATEGATYDVGDVLMTVENTDPACFWLTNYVETLLTHVWFPTTVATLGTSARGLLIDWLKETGCETGGVEFMLHDFGFRGVSSVEAAGIGGLAHLINFKGTDTIEAIATGIDYYDSGICGFSIPASEHSTITSWGEENEVEAYRNMLKAYPTGIMACVSDSYDILHACDLWGTVLKDEVLARDGVLVVRPDSGPPKATTLAVLRRLAQHFGAEKNEKGFLVLNPKVRVIWGDGIDLDGMDDVLNAMCREGWAAENIAFGMGGGLLQKHSRDTLNVAFKCCAIQVNGEWRDVYKTSPGKESKRGRVGEHLPIVFENGRIDRLYDFSQVRANAREA